MRIWTKHAATFGFCAIVFLSSLISYAHNFEDVGTFEFVGSGQTGTAINSQAQPAVCYFDAGNNHLKYAILIDGEWQASMVADNGAGSDCDLTFDNQDTPHIAYSVNASSQVMHAAFINGGWNNIVIAQDIGFSFLNSRPFSIKFSSQGQLGLAYYDDREDDLKYATYNDFNNSWQNQTLDSNNNTGEYPSLAYDSNGNPAIAFMKEITNIQSHLAFIAHDGQSWQAVETIDNQAKAGKFAQLVFDNNDTPYITYRNEVGVSKELRFVKKENGLWTQPVEISWNQNQHQSAMYNSMVTDKNGNLFIAYNYDFASGLFQNTSFIKLISQYFMDQTNPDNQTSQEASVAFNANGTNRFSAISMTMDNNYNLYITYTERRFGNLGSNIHVRKISTWKPAISLLTPDENSLPADAGTFNFEWLDFDPDSNAKIRFNWFDQTNWSNVHFGGEIEEDAANSAIIDTSAIPNGNHSINAMISDDPDFSSSIHQDMSTELLVVEGNAEEEEEEPAEEEPIEEDPAEEEAPAEEENQEAEEEAPAEDNIQEDSSEAEEASIDEEEIEDETEELLGGGNSETTEQSTTSGQTAAASAAQAGCSLVAARSSHSSFLFLGAYLGILAIKRRQTTAQIKQK